MKQRFWIIMALVVLFFIALIIAGGQSGTQRSGISRERGDPKLECRISATSITAVMLDKVKVTNENTGENMYIFYNDIPQDSTFNFVHGDVLTFMVFPKGTYQLNAWLFDDGTFSDANPLSLKPDKSFSIDIRMMPGS